MFAPASLNTNRTSIADAQEVPTSAKRTILQLPAKLPKRNTGVPTDRRLLLPKSRHTDMCDHTTQRTQTPCDPHLHDRPLIPASRCNPRLQLLCADLMSYERSSLTSISKELMSASCLVNRGQPSLHSHGECQATSSTARITSQSSSCTRGLITCWSVFALVANNRLFTRGR